MIGDWAAELYNAVWLPLFGKREMLRQRNSPAFPAIAMGQHSMDENSARSHQPEPAAGSFQLEDDHILTVHLNGEVWIRSGALADYAGQIDFRREGPLDHGWFQLLKRAVTGERTRLTRAAGVGQLHLVDRAKKILILRLRQNAVDVRGHEILALESGVQRDVQVLRKIAGLWGGGTGNVRLQGVGLAAVTTSYDPITLRVARPCADAADTSAPAAWSGSLKPEFRVETSPRVLLGGGNAESAQMCAVDELLCPRDSLSG
jgi:uncharacterized protein (AIM24 family)